MPALAPQSVNIARLPMRSYILAASTAAIISLVTNDVASAQSLSPVPNPTDGSSRLAATASLTDLGTNFLRRLGNHATWGYNAALGSNPGGGGASQAGTSTIPVRVWGEFYGLSSRTGPQGTFVGDKRGTIGGVAGFGATLAPDFNVGVWVDQSHTRINVPLAAQSALLDLTQVGVNASYTIGAWTLAAAGVHGFADIASQRQTTLGFAKAGYDGRVDAALGELSYYWGMGQARIVPKASIEYLRAATDSFSEYGGLNPFVAGSATAERTRILVGAEVGRYWIVDQRVLDLSAYGKFVDNIAQNVSAVQISLGTNSIAVQGIRESRYGADAGASVSLGLTNTIRLYLNYDGKFRDGFHSHQGLAGLEVKW